MDRNASGMKNLKIVGNERGAVLLTVLIMLILLTVLGIMTVSTSTTEIELSGNYRRTQTAFYTAESAIEYAMTAETIYTTSTLKTTPYSANLTIDDGNTSTPNYTSSIQVQYLSSGPVPISGDQQNAGETGFTADYYVASSTGTGPSSTQANIEVMYWRKAMN